MVEYGISAVVALITGNPRLVRMRPFNLVLLVSFCVVLKEPRGLYSEGLIYGGEFAFQNRLGYTYIWKEIYRFWFVLLCI